MVVVVVKYFFVQRSETVALWLFLKNVYFRGNELNRKSR